MLCSLKQRRQFAPQEAGRTPAMLSHTECAVALATHARRAARANAQEWLRADAPASLSAHQLSVVQNLRQQFGAALIAVGTRLAPITNATPPVAA
jgi:hypothetical protein